MNSFEQKYQIGTPGGSLVWDISKLILSLENTSFLTKAYSVEELYHQNGFKGNENYALSTDVDKPCIIVELNDKKQKLIDGNHRLFKAHKLGIQTISAYFLPKSYHTKFIVDYAPDLYDKITNEF